jgi:hypothetical protein
LLPLAFELFRAIGEPRNGFHVLQAKLHRYREAESCSMFHRELLAVAVRCSQRLPMTCVC